MPLTIDTAQQMRALWFSFLDAAAPHRPALHAYCLKLTGSLWDAEDLLQETLLKGFGVMGRMDLHGDGSRVRNLRAYLFRIATNAFIDGQRRHHLETSEEADAAMPAPSDTAIVTRAAAHALFDTAPQERAALVLTESFDFSLDEAATALDTTPGAIKSALRRVRGKLAGSTRVPATRRAPASPELLDRFIAAFQARDVAQVVDLLLDNVAIEVPGVGGGRGPGQIWAPKTIEHMQGTIERHTIAGAPVLASIVDTAGGRTLTWLLRIEEDDGKAARITDYYFCPETLTHAAAALGLAVQTHGHHQPGDMIAQMIADANLPWKEDL